MQLSLDQYILIGLSFVYIYFLIKQFLCHKNFNFLQQSSIAMVFGTAFGAFMFFFTDIFNQNNLNAEVRKIIFLILLPPLLFQDGYNVPKRKFFQNLFYINLYGLFGTIVNFFTIVLLVYVFNSYGLIVSVDNHSQTITLQNWQILLFAICLCSIDVVVPEKIINPERHPKMFSIIFGESIIKDTLTVTMFDAIVSTYQKLGQQQIDISTEFVGDLILDFLETSILSILIGIGTALITTLLFRCCRFLTLDEGVSQIALIIITGYAGYVISEMFQFSGVISMLFCGLVLSHFNIYNMTEKGKQSTKVVITMMKVITQGLLFFLLGAFVFNIQSFDFDTKGGSTSSAFSAVLFGLGLGGILIGRVLNIYLMSIFGYLIKGKAHWRLNWHEYAIIYLSGLIKGVVPFGLILIVPNSSTASSNCIETSIVFIVYLTSLFVNPILPKLIKWQIKKRGQLRVKQPQHPSMHDSLLFEDKKEIEKYFRQLNRNINNRQSLALKPKVSFDDQGDPDFMKKFKKDSAKYWKKFQQGCLKPLFIYNYHGRKDQIKLEKLKQRRIQYLEYLEKFQGFQKQNFLDTENQNLNKFIQIRLSDRSKSSYDSENHIYKIKRKSEMPKKGNPINELAYWKNLNQIDRQRCKTEFDVQDSLISSVQQKASKSVSVVKDAQELSIDDSDLKSKQRQRGKSQLKPIQFKMFRTQSVSVSETLSPAKKKQSRQFRQQSDEEESKSNSSRQINFKRQMKREQ